MLFELGGAADHLYVIDRGRVNLTLPMQVFGHEEDILVEERLAGQTLGWSALIPPHRFTLKATAQIDTELLAFRAGRCSTTSPPTRAVGYAVVGNVAATVGQRLQVFQAMWLREMKRVLELSRGDRGRTVMTRAARRLLGLGVVGPAARARCCGLRAQAQAAGLQAPAAAGPGATRVRPSASRCRRRRSPTGSSPARPATRR